MIVKQMIPMWYVKNINSAANFPKSDARISPSHQDLDHVL